MENEINMILPKFPENRKEKRCILTTLVSSFIGFIDLVYEGITSFLHNRGHKAVRAIERQTTQCNKHAFKRFCGNAWHL